MQSLNLPIRNILSVQNLDNKNNYNYKKLFEQLLKELTEVNKEDDDLIIKYLINNLIYKYKNKINQIE